MKLTEMRKRVLELQMELDLLEGAVQLKERRYTLSKVRKAEREGYVTVGLGTLESIGNRYWPDDYVDDTYESRYYDILTNERCADPTKYSWKGETPPRLVVDMQGVRYRFVGLHRKTWNDEYGTDHTYHCAGYRKVGGKEPQKIVMKDRK
jgi:hypothetical protein